MRLASGSVKVDFKLKFKIGKCCMCIVRRTAASHVGTVATSLLILVVFCLIDVGMFRFIDFTSQRVLRLKLRDTIWHRRSIERRS